MYKVLCIKDVAGQDEYLGHVIGQRGMKVTNSFGFGEAFHLMKGFTPDAILASISSLSNDSGKKFVKSLRSQETLTHIPIIGVCDNNESLTKSNSQSLGCSMLISKHQDVDDIHATLVQSITESVRALPSILLMEDDLEFITLVKEVLAGYELKVVDVTNGFDAMRLLKSNRFDLIITDIMVKGFNGFQLIDYVLKQGAGIPIVVITGAYPNGFDTYAKKLGIVDYFEKPFDLEEFAAKISKITKAKQVEGA